MKMEFSDSCESNALNISHAIRHDSNAIQPVIMTNKESSKSRRGSINQDEKALTTNNCSTLCAFLLCRFRKQHIRASSYSAVPNVVATCTESGVGEGSSVQTPRTHRGRILTATQSADKISNFPCFWRRKPPRTRNERDRHRLSATSVMDNSAPPDIVASSINREHDIKVDNQQVDRVTLHSFSVSGNHEVDSISNTTKTHGRPNDLLICDKIEYYGNRIECIQNQLSWMHEKCTRSEEKFTAGQISIKNNSQWPMHRRGDDYEHKLFELDQRTRSIVAKLTELKSDMEPRGYLSWLGFPVEDNPLGVPVPGRKAPAPNPQLSLIRRSDCEVRSTIDEFRQLCKTSLTEMERNELHEYTFNNWDWSDAHLARFVRQMFIDLGLVKHFQLPLIRLDVWLCDIYRRYNRVPFHNFKHAFMVTQMAYTIMWTAKLNTLLEKEDQMSLLIAAICHDLDHPGFNNAYQINAGTELAMRYNDQSPLENHHAAMAFEILSNAESNPFSHLCESTFRRIRETVIRCILATDMSRHNEIVTQFKTLFLSDLEAAWTLDPTTHRPMWTMDKTHRHIVLMIIIKVCDISNEARPLTVAGPWINRLLAEFFHQSDYEKTCGLSVAPFMDRDKVTKSASQCGFIRFVILPMFEALTSLFPTLKPVIVQPAIEQLEYYTEQKMREEAEENIVNADSADTPLTSKSTVDAE